VVKTFYARTSPGIGKTAAQAARNGTLKNPLTHAADLIAYPHPSNVPYLWRARQAAMNGFWAVCSFDIFLHCKSRPIRGG
jgi:hypothetical protein